MRKFYDIIVTGGAGFIGSNLVKKLTGLGHKVRVIDNLWRGSLDNLKNESGTYVIDVKKDFFLADLSDYSKCLELIRDADAVYHLADIVGGVHFALGNQEFIFRQNLLINSNVLSACTINRIEKYIYVGTACSFPKHLQMQGGIARLSEELTYPAEPESSYGWSKLMGEYEAELAQVSGKINIGLLRLHNVFGPGSSIDPDRSQVIPSLIRKAILYPQIPFIVWGSGSQYRDFIYIDDVIDALLLVATKGMNKGLIQIGTEKPSSIREVAEIIVDISRKHIEIQFDSGKPEGDRGRVAVCDRARSILQFTPQVSLEAGLKKTYDWINKILQ